MMNELKAILIQYEIAKFQFGICYRLSESHWE